ncbi:hypothetical protein H0H93_003873, partial [Arthromyces matolae]
MSKSPDSVLVNTVAECYSVKAVHGTEPSRNDLESIPVGAQLGLGCGNPIITANLKEVIIFVVHAYLNGTHHRVMQGEVVVDLGSGGGIDVFLAASKVGPRGQAIGLDISSEMINRARKNAAEKGFKPPQVAFVHASLAEPLPIHSNTVDCVLSNCVVNLLPGGKKEELLKELHRVLKPGGRLVIDDGLLTTRQIVAKRPLSDEIRNDLTAYLNCVAGSIVLEEYKSILDNAGLKGAILQETGNDLQEVCNGGSEGGCCKSTCVKPPYNVNEWVASYQITAKKEVVTEGDDSAPTSPTVLLRWWDVYPKVKSAPEQVSIEEIEALIRGSGVAGDFAVIDVRRDDRV